MARQKKQDQVFDHDFDGIQEYDNDMPSWWINLFLITVVFALIYVLWYHVTPLGDSSTVKYMKQVDPNYTRLPEDQGINLMDLVFKPEHTVWHDPHPEVTQATLFSGQSLVAEVEEVPVDTTVVMLTGGADISAGKGVYDQYCFSCHGRVGEGGIGPNLTDEYWLNGGRFADVVHTIKKGVPLNGMIAWERSINPEQLMQVASYVYTLVGTTPPNPKAAQGDIYVASAE
jgi:cytochrome c oxidase cbb3-type subunit III